MTTRLLGTDPTTVDGGEALVVLTRAAARVAVPLGLVIVVAALLLRGPAAALTALGAAVVLVGLHVGSGLVTARLSRGNPQAMPAITMVALFVRLVVYGGFIVLLGDVDAVDVPALAVTVLTLTLATLGVESWLVARYSRHWWQPTAPAAPRDIERTEA